MKDISELLPHRGTARLLQRLLHFSEAQVLVATATHRSPDNPLLHAGRLASVHLIEYGAQAMALHGALRTLESGGSPRSALLVSVRDFRCSLDYVDDLAFDLEVSARELLSSAASWQYTFEVSHAGVTIASGRVAAMAHALPGS
jgi:predicted hotdog family 3-hydroxylacyl-ACP dehydratase